MVERGLGSGSARAAARCISALSRRPDPASETLRPGPAQSRAASHLGVPPVVGLYELVLGERDARRLLARLARRQRRRAAAGGGAMAWCGGAAAAAGGGHKAAAAAAECMQQQQLQRCHHHRRRAPQRCSPLHGGHPQRALHDARKHEAARIREDVSLRHPCLVRRLAVAAAAAAGDEETRLRARAAAAR